MNDTEKAIEKIAKVSELGIELAGMVKRYLPEGIDPFLDGDIRLRNKALELLSVWGGKL